MYYNTFFETEYLTEIDEIWNRFNKSDSNSFIC